MKEGTKYRWLGALTTIGVIVFWVTVTLSIISIVSVENIKKELTKLEQEIGKEPVKTERASFTQLTNLERDYQALMLLFPRYDYEEQYTIVEKTGNIIFYYDVDCQEPIAQDEYKFWSTESYRVDCSDGISKAYMVLLEDKTPAYCKGNQYPYLTYKN